MSDTWILYQTTNLVNDKIYVGVHKLANTANSRKYLGSGYALKPAIKKYGRANFVRETLAEFSCAKDAYLAEANIVDEEFCNRIGTYNMKTGGRGGSTCNKETKAKMSMAKKGKPRSDETKTKIGAASRGHTFNLGRKHSEEAKAKMSAFHKGNTYSLGFKHSEDTLIKMSIAHKGITHTDEAKAKIALANNIPVVINGKYYISAKRASELEKIAYKTLHKRVKNPRPAWAEWRLATEEEIASFSTRN
jgi:group I intron endonuclease